MSDKKQTIGKRQMLREQRRREARRNRILIIMGITLVALLILGLAIVPSIQSANVPIGEIVQITPVERPLVNGRELGVDNAPVTVESFVDFQCPACLSFSETVEMQMIEKYVANEQVRYIFRHYPFIDDRAIGEESDQAANASMCAAEQGRFWDYHDMLFANWSGENQGAFIDKRLVAFAETLGLDMQAFNECFQENRFKDEIEQDTALGQQYGATGTPSVFVNGEIVSPGFVPTFDQLQQAIEAALAAAGN